MCIYFPPSLELFIVRSWNTRQLAFLTMEFKFYIYIF